MSGVDDDEAQPESLEQWHARALAELEAMRAQAHREIDAHFDGHAKRLALEVSCIERDMAGVALN